MSVGTGKNKRPYPYEKSKDWGAINWVGPLIDIMFDGSDEVVHHQIAGLLPESPENIQYWRFQCTLDNSNDSIDNANDQNVKNLISLGDQLISSRRNDISALLTQLMHPGKVVSTAMRAR